MPVSNLVSLRSFPEHLRVPALVAYASAREALIETHQVQLVQFVREFSRRLPLLDAFRLYFRVVPVPQNLEEPVQCRALVAMNLDRLPDLPPAPGLVASLRALRLDLVLESWRERRRTLEAIHRLAHLAGARAEEAVLDTHVANAIEIANLLEESVWVDEAIGHYIHTFRLPLPSAHMVYQRARARVAHRHLAELLEPRSEAIPLERRKELRLTEQSVRIAG